MKKHPNPNHFLTGTKQTDEHIKKRVESRRKNGTYVGLKGEKNPFYGKPAWNKGKKGLQSHSKETRMLMRLLKLGKKLTPEHIHNATIARMETAKKTGFLQSSARAEKISKALKGRIISKEWAKKISDAWIYEKHATPEIRRKARENRLHQIFPTKDTKPEKMMQIALALNGIKFEKHKPILGQPDIFIEPNICVFVDGDYPHANPEKYDKDFVVWKKPKTVYAADIWARDSYVTHQLNHTGYLVIRVWASKIKEDANICARNIINLIRSSSYLAEGSK